MTIITFPCVEKKYVIYNLRKECFEGYFDSGVPSFPRLYDSAFKFSLQEAESQLKKLDKIGITDLKIKEYDLGLYD